MSPTPDTAAAATVATDNATLYYTLHPPQELTYTSPTADHQEQDSSTGLLWVPYVVLTGCLVALTITSFVRFHIQNRQRYRHRTFMPKVLVKLRLSLKKKPDDDSQQANRSTVRSGHATEGLELRDGSSGGGPHRDRYANSRGSLTSLSLDAHGSSQKTRPSNLSRILRGFRKSRTFDDFSSCNASYVNKAYEPTGDEMNAECDVQRGGVGPGEAYQIGEDDLDDVTECSSSIIYVEENSNSSGFTLDMQSQYSLRDLYDLDVDERNSDASDIDVNTSRKLSNITVKSEIANVQSGKECKQVRKTSHGEIVSALDYEFCDSNVHNDIQTQYIAKSDTPTAPITSEDTANVPSSQRGAQDHERVEKKRRRYLKHHEQPCRRPAGSDENSSNENHTERLFTPRTDRKMLVEHGPVKNQRHQSHASLPCDNDSQMLDDTCIDETRRASCPAHQVTTAE